MDAQNNKLTILITLKDRWETTPRMCEYFSAINIPFEVVFADGSIGGENERFLDDYKQKANFKFRYVRYPKDETLAHFYNKFKNSVEIIETPYVMFADNDDFPIVSGINKAIDFLDEHMDYVGCAGRVGTVMSSKRRESFFIANFTNDYEICRNINENGLLRIENYQKNCPYFHYYSVFHTSNVRKTLKTLVEVNPSDILNFELLINYMMCAQGKIEELPCLTYVRDLMTSMTSELRMSKNYLERALFDNIIEDYRKTVDFVLNELLLLGEGKYEELRDKIYKILIKYPSVPFLPDELCKKEFNIRRIFNIPRILRVINRNIFKVFPAVASKLSHLTMKGHCSEIELKSMIDVIKKY